MKRTVALIILSFICLRSFGWGGEHRYIAYVAMKHLTPTTQKALDFYLDRPITEYAAWMDGVREHPDYAYTHIWHCISLTPDNKVSMEPLHWVPSMNKYSACLPAGLTQAISLVANRAEQTDSTVSVNLRYIIHLVGELHCPGHIYLNDMPEGYGHYYGYFKMKYKGESTTYHAIFDSTISKAWPGLDEEQMSVIIDTWPVEKQMECCKGSVIDWCQNLIPDIPQIYDWAKPGDDIDDSFWTEYRKEYLLNLYRLGSYRLAYVLNTLFDPQFPKAQ